MIILLTFLVLVIYVLIIVVVIYYYIKNKKSTHYCDLYLDSKLFNKGFCSAGPNCDECPHKKRLV